MTTTEALTALLGAIDRETMDSDGGPFVKLARIDRELYAARQARSDPDDADKYAELQPLAVRLVALLREADALIGIFVPPNETREKWRAELRPEIAAALAVWDAPWESVDA